MITLNTEKGLIKIETWEDITSRPGYMDNLDPRDKKLKSIIGNYRFKDKIRCGLSNCHTPHAKGYIATTEDGYETNIGQDCGKKYFGVDFETLSRKFDRDVKDKDNRDLLWSFRSQLTTVNDRIDVIRKEQGGDWVYKGISALTTLNKGCPESVIVQIKAMAKARSGVLTKPRLATNEEIDNLEAIQGKRVERPYYIDEKFAELSGIEALYPENDLRNLLALELTNKIKSFQSVDIDQMTAKELSTWAKWATNVEVTLNKAEVVIGIGKRLLKVDNLKLLLAVLDQKKDASEFAAFLSKLKNTAC